MKPEKSVNFVPNPTIFKQIFSAEDCVVKAIEKILNSAQSNISVLQLSIGHAFETKRNLTVKNLLLSEST